MRLVWNLMLEAVFIAICGIVAEAMRTWFYQTLQMRWRRWLTDVYLKKWLKEAAFYRIENSYHIDNVDQRISEDLKNMTDIGLYLSLGFFSNLINLLTFSVVIWNISGTLSFELLNVRIDIPGYMLWISIIYAVVSSVFLEKKGKKMVAVEYEQQLRESDFRFQLMRIRENSTQIAMSKGSDTERKLLKHFFQRLR